MSSNGNIPDGKQIMLRMIVGISTDLSCTHQGQGRVDDDRELYVPILILGNFEFLLFCLIVKGLIFLFDVL